MVFSVTCIIMSHTPFWCVCSIMVMINNFILVSSHDTWHSSALIKIYKKQQGTNIKNSSLTDMSSRQLRTYNRKEIYVSSIQIIELYWVICTKQGIIGDLLAHWANHTYLIHLLIVRTYIFNITLLLLRRCHAWKCFQVYIVDAIIFGFEI